MNLNPQIKKRLLRTLAIVIAGLIVGGAMGALQIKNANDTPPKTQGIAGVKIGGPFTLVNQNGETVTDQTYKGQYKLMYFGFTYCPAVCPTELQKMIKALNSVGALSERIQPIFITVDPERDTQKVMKDYVSLYSPRLIGLTGTPAQISSTLKDYKIYAAKVQEKDANDYTMDHSSFIYLIDGQDNLLGIYRSEDSADTIAADIKQKLTASP